MKLFVLKKPFDDPATLARCVFAEQRPSEEWQEMTQEQLRQWQQNELAAGWAPPNPDSQPVRWQVSRDSLWNAIRDKIGIDSLMVFYDQMPKAMQVELSMNDWFWSDNQNVNGMLMQIGLNADEIMREAKKA